MIRSACAMGVKEVLIAGNRKNITFFGSQGTAKHATLRHFAKLKDAVAYARRQGCAICGVEIKPQARSVLSEGVFDFQDKPNMAFILGNEGVGMSDVQCAACDFFVRIPQYGDSTASLNVTVAASIVFHRFASYAGYPEHEAEGEKFVVKDLPQKRGPTTEADFALREERKKRRELAQLKAQE